MANELSLQTGGLSLNRLAIVPVTEDERRMLAKSPAAVRKNRRKNWEIEMAERCRFVLAPGGRGAVSKLMVAAMPDLFPLRRLARHYAGYRRTAEAVELLGGKEMLVPLDVSVGWDEESDDLATMQLWVRARDAVGAHRAVARAEARAAPLRNYIGMDRLMVAA